MSTILATGVLARNSLEFVETAFKLLRKEQPLLVIKDANKPPEDSGALRVRQTLQVGDSTGWYSGIAYEPNDSAEIAQIAYTSGTEGEPKAICISHRALSNTVERLVQVMRMDDGISEYVGIPVYHSFGFGRCRAVSQVGGRFYLPPAGFDPLEIARMLEADEINAISAVPSLWRVLLDVGELFEEAGHKLRWIEIGSQYFSAEEKTALRRLFPNAKIVQHYGLTEASRSTFLDVGRAASSQLESVGQPLFGVRSRVNDSGAIELAGPHLASFMIVDGEVRPLTSDDGWLTTSDRGRLEQGYLFFEGRIDDVINCAGVKLSPERLERQLRERLGLSGGVAVFGMPDKYKGEVPHIALCATVLDERQLSEEDLQASAREVFRSEGVDPGARLPIHRLQELPTTDTGKIQRRLLPERITDAAGAKGAASEPTEASSPLEQQIISVWEDTLNISPVSPHDNFFELGGDSLSAIRVTIAMERAGLDRAVCREIFKGLSIRQLVTKTEAGDDSSGVVSEASELSKASQALNIVRGLLVLLNIAAHWMPGVVERAPAIVADCNRYLAPVYSSGTPGFAVIFGAGIGFYLYPRFEKSPTSITPLIARNALILALGIAALAGTRVLETLALGVELTPVLASNFFWSVLTFYLYAVLSIPLWFALLRRWQVSLSQKFLALAVVLYCAHLAFAQAEIPSSESPWLQPFVLALTAKYNYFELFAGSLVGAAFGHSFRESTLRSESLGGYALGGGALVAFSIGLSFEMGSADMWFIWPKGLYLWSWSFYVGLVMLTVAGVGSYLRQAGRQPGFVANLLSVVGILAFPLFVTHELVLPLRGMLQAWGVPGSLGIAVLLFFATGAWMLRHLYRLYYSSDLPSARAAATAEADLATAE